MPSEPLDSPNVVGRRMRSRREELGWSQEKVGVMIGLDESSARARISRYELGVHEPPFNTVKLLADALRVPVAYLYSEDEDLADLLHALSEMPQAVRKGRIKLLIKQVRGQL